MAAATITIPAKPITTIRTMAGVSATARTTTTDHYDRYFHPADNVSCDRKRDICYDRFGPSYYATARYLGESEANQAYNKYGDSVFLFSPRPGVSCDRRTKECSDGQWTGRAAPDPLRRLEPGNMGSIGAGSGFEDDDQPVRRVAPARRSDDDDAVSKRITPRVEARRRRWRTTTTTWRGRRAGSRRSSPRRGQGSTQATRCRTAAPAMPVRPGVAPTDPSRARDQAGDPGP